MIKVLVVEDDPMVSKLHEVYINQLDGFKLAHTSKNSEDALEYLTSQNVDLVILDVFMPGKDGMELLQDIRSQGINVDIIMISAANDKERIMKALRLGVFDYIIKPFEFERFSIALNNYKQRYLICRKDGTLSQTELDYSYLCASDSRNIILSCGNYEFWRSWLEETTLYNVWQEIVKIDGNFTTEEISKKVGISRVSIRKYLEFLKSINILHLELNRGSVGRPVYKYKCINRNATIVSSYVE